MSIVGHFKNAIDFYEFKFMVLSQKSELFLLKEFTELLLFCNIYFCI